MLWLPDRVRWFVLATLALGACAPPFHIMPNHTPEALLAQPPEAQSVEVSFGKQPIAIELVADLSVSPVGGYLDDLHDNITPANQSYVMGQPGLVLFEKVVDALTRRGAVVLRSYETGAAPATAATRVSLVLRDFELHLWKRAEGGPVYLARAELETRVRGAAGGATTTLSSVQARVSALQDPFAALADSYVRVLHGALAGGGSR